MSSAGSYSLEMIRRLAVSAVATVAVITTVLGCSSSENNASSSSTTDTRPTRATTTTQLPDQKAVPSSGCGRTQVLSVKEKKTFLDDSNRWYLLSTPLTHDGDTPLPLVVDFHGWTEGAAIHSKLGDLATTGDEEGFIVVQPEGTDVPVRWGFGTDPKINTDLEFVTELLDELEAKLCVDRSRVYATGFSNGAMLSSSLACVMADRFAAIAPVAGVSMFDGCKPTRPVPVLAVHGTADDILKFNGGGGAGVARLAGSEDSANDTPAETTEVDINGPGYPAAAQKWADLNGCKPDPTDSKFTDSVIRRTWDCPQGGDVEFLIVNGGGHSWPGSRFAAAASSLLGSTDMSFSINDEMWKFFSRFTVQPK